MWGEGASDLWGRLERDEDEREAELLEAMRERLRGGSDREDREKPGTDGSFAGLETAA
jgi:hypothetical protein